MIEFILTNNYFVFLSLQSEITGLWVCRKTGKFHLRDIHYLAKENKVECLGIFWSIVGKYRIQESSPEYLILVRGCDRIGSLPHCSKDSSVYKVTNVIAVPIVEENNFEELSLKPCPKHDYGTVKEMTDASNSSSMSKLMKLDPIKLLTAGTDSIKFAGSVAAAGIVSQVKNPWQQGTNKKSDKFEKRILEEFLKIFNETDSFYFCYHGDLSRSLQGRTLNSFSVTENGIWRMSDDRFFVNKYMVEELIEMSEDRRIDSWIIPLLQGYIEFSSYSLKDSSSDLQSWNGLPDNYQILLISRRSRHMAGTRYKRRGIDEEGNVANFVETEQILIYHHYILSFVILRGSVPLYWSQPGVRYRPPPVLDKSPEEDFLALSKHLTQVFMDYGPSLHIVSLVQRTGREKILHDAFVTNASLFNDARLKFTSFDFHEYCKGMHFENIEILIQALESDIRSANYCWLDKQGIVCQQRGIFRINCIDCLDRTNLIQTAIARTVLQNQLTKLGLILPDESFEESSKLTFQSLWANNGDVISRQYAGNFCRFNVILCHLLFYKLGTNALKGDFTRTGERNLSGLMRDGMNSANRYYLNQFRDSFRQMAIDLMMGKMISQEAIVALNEETEDEDNESDEHVKTLIDDTVKLLIPEGSNLIGSWGLIDGDPITGCNSDDVDIIFILTSSSYYVAYYDESCDKITQFTNVSLFNIDKIEFGIYEKDLYSLSHFTNIKRKEEHCFRITYRIGNAPEELDYSHTFRSSRIRYFNNIPVEINSNEEKNESLKYILDTLIATLRSTEPSKFPSLHIGGKLEKSKSKAPPQLIFPNKNFSTSSSSSSSFKIVSSKLSSFGSAFASRINGMKSKRKDEVSDFQQLHSEIGQRLFVDKNNVSLSKSSDDVTKSLSSTIEIRSVSSKNLSSSESNYEECSSIDSINKGIQNIECSRENEENSLIPSLTKILII